MLKIDKQRLVQIYNDLYHDEIVGNNTTIKINHQLLDCYYPELIEDLEDNYKLQIHQMTRIFNEQRIQQPNQKTKIKFYNVRPIIPLNELHQKYNNKFVSFEGIVKKRSKVSNKITRVCWECNACSHDYIYLLEYDEELYPPKKPCKACGRTAGYTINRKKSQYKDIQLITIQEPLDTIKQGFQPTEVKVYLENDMINIVKPGDKIRVNGVLELRNTGKKNLFTEYIVAEYIEKLEQDFEDITLSNAEIKEIEALSQREDIFELIQRSTAPSLYGNEELKEAIALQLFNSPSITKRDGSYMRGDIHILMVGDPGVGKSQILKYVSNLAPRCVYTSGKGSSGVGLTATAVKDEFGGWSLEAGAMVLADNGNVCIDEFDKMREEDRSAIHEALEQQTISISKAGITTTLNSRCSVLAAANPKFGSFDEYKSVTEQIKLSSPILSRFDLIFIIKDRVDKERDKNIAMSILLSGSEDEEEIIPQNVFKKYISYARKTINPELTPEVRERISDFFTEWRELALVNNNPVPVTARQLESVMRLAKASARIRLSSTVSIEDAERAIKLQEFCMKHVGFDIETGSSNAVMLMGGDSSSFKKYAEQMMIITKQVIEDYGGKAPQHILIRELQSKNIKRDIILKWLHNEDESGTLLYDGDEETWELMNS